MNLTDEDLTLYKPFRLGFSERLKHDVHEICQWTGTDPMGKPVAVSAFVSKRWGNNNSIHIKIPSDQKDYLSGPEIATFDIGPELQDWSFDRSKGVAFTSDTFEIAGFFLMIVKAARAGVNPWEMQKAFKEAAQKISPGWKRSDPMGLREIDELKWAFSANLAKAHFLL